VALIDLASLLAEAESPLALAQRLGELCLSQEAELRQMRLETYSASALGRIETAVGATSYAEWERLLEEPERLGEVLGEGGAAALRLARNRQPLDFLGVLRGLCRRPLPEFFKTVRGQVLLDFGMPVPFATRPLPALLSGITTEQVKLNNMSLLDPYPYSLFRHSANESVRVCLDFSHRDRIDDLTWSPDTGLPIIATVHPNGGGQFVHEPLRSGRLFGVRPKHWDPAAVTDLLALAKAEGAVIAVLPELSLPTPGELGEELTNNPDRYPPIVVAGSAHWRPAGKAAGEIRANESRTYLDGRAVAVARKHHLYKTDKLANEEVLEDITQEQKTLTVLSGQLTRIATVICADLLETSIPELLVGAGVNLLLVPAMSSKIGSFNAPICQIAGICQGVAAIANTRFDESGMPFLCLLSAPFEKPAEQSAALPEDALDGAPNLGIFNPNLPLPIGFSWI